MRMLLRNVIFLLSLSMYEADKSFCFLFSFRFFHIYFQPILIILGSQITNLSDSIYLLCTKLLTVTCLDSIRYLGHGSSLVSFTLISMIAKGFTKNPWLDKVPFWLKMPWIGRRFHMVSKLI